jgi:polysaccharide biosynthesis transport protein
LDPLPEKELTLRDLLTIFRRRSKVVFGTLLSVALLAAIYCTFCTRRYEASGTVQMQKESADAMGLSSLMSGSEGASDALGANIELQTQANILQSNTLALRTIEDLHLEGTKDFHPHWNPIGAVLGAFSPRGAADPPNATLENSPQRRQRVIQIFKKNLKVKPISGTRLIEIDYQNPDPQIAAAVVNKLSQTLVDYTFQTRYNAANQTSEWLSKQLGELRQNSEDLQAKVVGLQKESGVYSLGTTDQQGKEQAYSGVLDQLQQATLAVNQASQNRILKGAIAQAAASGNAEMLSGLAGNTIGPNSQATSNSLNLIQTLRQQQATQQGALQEAEAKYGASYPKLGEMRGNIAGLERAIHQEVERLKGRAKSDYAVAVQTEASTRSQYDQAKKQADKLNDKAVEYTIVRQEAEQSRGLYEDLLKRLKEAGVLEGLRSSNITVVDPGRVPAKPQKPAVPLYMAIAIGGGFFLGCCGALLVDVLDNKINSTSQVEELIGQSVLGALPNIEKSVGFNDIQSLKEPHSTYTEAIRAIRTSLLLSQRDSPTKTILITSSVASEGKTTFSLNLAVILAQSGRRVLLIDADLRRGLIKQKLNLPDQDGLSALLAGIKKNVIRHPVAGAPNLEVIAGGAVPPNPSELLDSKTMQNWLKVWKDEYDFVVVDGAPVLPVTDSVTLSAEMDATIVLVRSGMTEKSQLKRSYQLLARNNKRYMGVIFNCLGVDDAGYYGYYGYRQAGYTEEDRDA